MSPGSIQLSQILASLFAGLGMFFIGVKMIGTHLKQLAGPRMRRLVEASVRSRVRGSMLGTLAGVMTQSSNAVTFILASMISAGLLDVRRAVPVVVWSSVGTSSLVLVATVDIRLAVFCLLGLIGTAYFFGIDKSPRYREVAGAALGAALLFLGLELIHQGARPAGELEGFRAYLLALSQFGILLLFASVAVTVVLQSSSTVSVIAVTMAGAGLLDPEQAFVVITGANAGSGLSVLLMSAGQGGSTRQLALVQVQAKLFASLLGLCAIFVERHSGVPWIVSLGQHAGIGTPMQGALYFLALQVAGAALATVLGNTFLALARHLSPEGLHEALARPRYISEQALEESSTAMDLVELELARLLGHIQRYLSQAEPSPRLLTEEPAACRATASELADADARVAVQLGAFMGELAGRYHDPQATARFLRLQERLRATRELGQTVRELDGWLLRIDDIDDANREHCVGLKSRITESCHFLLGVLHDAAASRDEQDIGLLELLAHDRSEVMDALRKGWLQQAASTGQPMLEALFAATSLVERFVWILGRLRQTLEASPQNR